MITIEKIEKDSILSGLTDEQKNAVVAMSKGDEEQSFSTRFSEIHNSLDAAVKEASGMEKGGTEKTTEFIKRAFGKLTAELDAARGDNTALKEKNATLAKQIEDGSADKALIDSQKATIEDLRGRYNSLKEESEGAKAEYEARLTGLRIEAEIGAALGGIALKDDMNPQALEVLKRQAVASVKGKNPAFVADGNGTERLVFRDTNGVELVNADNKLAPYTAKELLAKELEGYGVLADGKARGGMGGNGSQGGGKTAIGASTKVEAMEAIKADLASRGIARTDQQYQAEFDRLWKENNVDGLPMS